MRIALIVGLPLGLAACVAQPAQPTFVDVSRAGIEVRMSDRQTCIGVAPGPGQNWSGTLQGCDSAYPYRVTLDPSGNNVRAAVNEALGGAINLVAVVEIDGPAGNTWTIRTPGRVDFEEPSPRLR